LPLFPSHEWRNIFAPTEQISKERDFLFWRGNPSFGAGRKLWDRAGLVTARLGAIDQSRASHGGAHSPPEAVGIPLALFSGALEYYLDQACGCSLPSVPRVILSEERNDQTTDIASESIRSSQILSHERSVNLGGSYGKSLPNKLWSGCNSLETALIRGKCNNDWSVFSVRIIRRSRRNMLLMKVDSVH